jgi:uncharacterized protein involved in exopolysaccharide biosynthesis
MSNQTKDPKKNERKKLALILGLFFGTAAVLALATVLPLTMCHSDKNTKFGK